MGERFRRSTRWEVHVGQIQKRKILRRRKGGTKRKQKEEEWRGNREERRGGEKYDGGDLNVHKLCTFNGVKRRNKV